MSTALAPELLVFTTAALELSFFMALASVHFHTLIFSIVLVCLKSMERQLLVLPSIPQDVLLFFTNSIKKMAVWKTTYMSEHLNTDHLVPIDQVFFTRCMLYLL